MSINKVIILGRIGKDPETKTFDNGNSVTSFSVATSENYKDSNGEYQEKTEWHNIVSWNKKGQVIQNHFTKGSEIALEGKLQTRSWESNGEKRYSTEIMLTDFSFVGSKKDGNPPF